jgi:hypothetical protein
VILSAAANIADGLRDLRKAASLKALTHTTRVYPSADQLIVEPSKAHGSRVELFDHRNKLGFRVFDIDGNAVLPLSSSHASWVRKTNTLRSRINALRQRVEEEGYTLDPHLASDAFGRPSFSVRTMLRATVKPVARCFSFWAILRPAACVGLSLHHCHKTWS